MEVFMSKLGSKVSGLLVLATMFGSISAFAEGYGFVAIAFDKANPTNYGAFHGGYADSQSDIEAQAASAMGAAAQNVGYTWAHDGWVALAGSSNGVASTAGMHDSEYDAENSALSNCQADGGQNCYIIRSLSSYEGAAVDPDGIKRN
jgi:hypothetical protein